MTDAVWYRIDAPRFVAGFSVNDGVVESAAPILAWMKGRPGDQMVGYCKRRGWIVERVDGPKRRATQEAPP